MAVITLSLMRANPPAAQNTYTLPSLWQFYQPSRTSHGSYWFDWTTADEIEWKNNFRLWMQFINGWIRSANERYAKHLEAERRAREIQAALDRDPKERLREAADKFRNL